MLEDPAEYFADMARGKEHDRRERAYASVRGVTSPETEAVGSDRLVA